MATAAGPANPQSGWLFGPATDLFLGCGLGSIAISLALVFQAEAISLWVPGALLVLLFSLPHYGATLLRVYELPEDRRRYSLVAVGATTLLAMAFIGGLQSAFFGSLVLTIYLTWSPWHYTGQNYGVFLILARRRGIAVSPTAKRLLYASFILSYALTFLAIHGLDRPGQYAPVSYAGTIYQLLPLGLPAAVSVPLFWGLAGAYGVSLIAAVSLLWRGSSLAQLGPPAVVLVTQALWFSLPVALRYSLGPGSVPGLAGIYNAYGFLWIASAHAVQYLWITTYFAKTSGRAPSTGGYLGRTALAGFAVWTVPALVFAPSLLGSVPHEAGLAVLVAAVVNLHHFVLDGVIWKLRDGRIAKVLLRAQRENPKTPGSSRHWGLRSLALVGSVCIALGLAALFEEGALERAIASRDVRRAAVAVERLGWLGREGPRSYERLGRLYAAQGQLARAEHSFRRSLASHPTVDAWRSLALLYEQSRNWQASVSAYDGLLGMLPDDGPGVYRRGLAQLEAGNLEAAVADLRHAEALHPEQKIIALSRARAETRLQQRGEPEAKR